MKQTAVTIAVFGFFIFAAAGWLCGLSPFACSVKALTGAIVLYFVAGFAGKVFVNVMVQTVMKAQAEQAREDEESSSEIPDE